MKLITNFLEISYVREKFSVIFNFKILLIIFSLANNLIFAQTTQNSEAGKVRILLTAARSQVNKTLSYDPRYSTIAYPNGDVDLAKGVCTDVIIRAYRQAFKFDFQKAVHEDMATNFSVYPKIWGLKKTDKNIDHRRVPNLQVYLTRKHFQVNTKKYQPGDLVTQIIANKYPHIAIVSDKMSADGQRPLVIHNIGNGTKEEDSLYTYPITGHYRFIP